MQHRVLLLGSFREVRWGWCLAVTLGATLGSYIAHWLR